MGVLSLQISLQVTDRNQKPKALIVSKDDMILNILRGHVWQMDLFLSLGPVVILVDEYCGNVLETSWSLVYLRRNQVNKFLYNEQFHIDPFE